MRAAGRGWGRGAGWLALIGSGLVIASLIHAAEEQGGIVGVWKTTDDKSEVRIYEEKGKFFGKIVSLKEPNVPAGDKSGLGGKPKTDYHNPKPELRQRPIIGLQIMTDFAPDGPGHWTGGKVYDPESGKTYKSWIALVATNRLEVRGYLGVSLLGRTVTWTR